MAEENERVDPGGGGVNENGGVSYRDKLKVNIQKSERLKRNVLEINLETENGNHGFHLDKDTIAKLASKIGINIKTDIEGFQISKHISLRRMHNEFCHFTLLVTSLNLIFLYRKY